MRDPGVKPPLRLLTASFPGDAVLEAAFSAALLARVGEGAPAAFRIARPGPAVSFGRLDRLARGYAAAADTARAHGFEPVLRVGGGRAAAIHEQAIAFGLAAPPGEGSTTERFVAMTDLVRSALRRLGVPAEVGELPGEYCPGAWSLHAAGVKLAGIDQRVTRTASWTEGFLVVRDGLRVRDVLSAVYDALELPWDPRTAGALSDLDGAITCEAAAAALRSELAERYVLAEVDGDPGTLKLAEGLRERHEVQLRFHRAGRGRDRP
jgi:lipoate-protein ligase A